jgi:aspartyl-tRNA(Asn)/glutamyl-tRNA(Gln) amidotransferase subunit A
VSAELDALSAREAARIVANKEISPVELVRRALDKAEESQATINAFCVLRRDAALVEAKRAEDAVQRGEPLGPLHGVPFSVKDLISVAGLPYASGSRAMADNVGTVDAPSVERARAAGAILIGKTTTSEFGCKPVGDSPLTGITRNPLDLSLTPGGSSAGCAASVAAGVTPFALGTDGGGSIRIPAALTGTFGFKANFGRVPVWPASATPTLAHVCPLARNVADAALLLQAIAGYDPCDPASIAGPVPDFLAACEAPPRGLRVAWSPTLGYATAEPEVVDICARAARRLEQAGCVVEEVERVFAADPEDLWTAEFYAGVGTRLRPILETRRDLLDPAVATILEAALQQDMRAYYETVFRRYALRDDLLAFFSRYDVLLSPTLPIVALEAGRDIPPGLEHRNLVSWVYYTYPFNLTGQPAASLPVGLAKPGLPVGMQIIAGRNDETTVLKVAAWLEREIGVERGGPAHQPGAATGRRRSRRRS